MSIDHGELNVPLSKRGDIDAQVDRYKAEQAKAAAVARKATSADLAAARKTAKALVAEIALDDPRLLLLCRFTHKTPRQQLAALRSDAHWQPTKVIREWRTPA